jgi:hypothetical protein
MLVGERVLVGGFGVEVMVGVGEGETVRVLVRVGVWVLVGVAVRVAVREGVWLMKGVNVGVISSGRVVQVGALVREGESWMVGEEVEAAETGMAAASRLEAVPTGGKVAKVPMASKPAGPPPGRLFPHMKKATNPMAATTTSASVTRTMICSSVRPKYRLLVGFPILAMASGPLPCLVIHLTNITLTVYNFFSNVVARFRAAPGIGLRKLTLQEEQVVEWEGETLEIAVPGQEAIILRMMSPD